VLKAGLKQIPLKSNPQVGAVDVHDREGGLLVLGAKLQRAVRPERQ
jgi:hypothetical protein